MEANNSSSTICDDLVVPRTENYLRKIEIRFYLISIFAASIAVISVLENILLVIAFKRRQSFEKTRCIYLMVLAIFDITHAFSYVMTMCIGIIYEYYEDFTLKRFWLSYVMAFFTLSHVILCASQYLLVAVSLERLLMVNSMIGLNRSLKVRLVAISVVIMLAVISKGSVLFEFQIDHYSECNGTDAEYVIAGSSIMANEFYTTVWCFWYRNIATVFLPFLLLVTLNLGIVYKQSCTSNQNENQMKLAAVSPQKYFLPGTMVPLKMSLWMMRARNKVRRQATRTFVIIVLEHLLLASLSVLITLWEHIDIMSLMVTHSDFYTFGSDMISIFTVFGCAIRLPTYCIADYPVRNDVKRLLVPLIRCIRSIKWECRIKKYVSSSEHLSTTAAPSTYRKTLSAASTRQSEYLATMRMSYAVAQFEVKRGRKRTLIERSLMGSIPEFMVPDREVIV